MRLSLIEDLLKGPLAPGASLLVEYDPTAAWYQTSLNIAAGWLRSGGVVTYGVTSQPPDAVRSQLARLGLDVTRFESEDKLRVFDWYTATLGRKSSEKYAFYSLKAADLSVLFSKYLMASPDSTADKMTITPSDVVLFPSPSPDWLRILDDISCLSRFNEEKSWVEFVRTRLIPIGGLWKSTGIGGIIKGIHSDWVYKNLEAASDGVIDIKLDESTEEAKTMIRIRSMRNVAFDSHWHMLNLNENLEATLEQ
jgi:KaiC/GvpD/RAD55 family RecA-like ATPase